MSSRRPREGLLTVQSGPLQAFNLTVQDYATYFVAANDNAVPVWVHNCPVSKYESGSYDQLSKKESVGDSLDKHHVPQAHAAEQLIDGYNKKTASSIMIPRAEHLRIPVVKGKVADGTTARSQLAKDVRDLRNYTNASNSEIKDVIDDAKDKYDELK